MNQRVRKMCGQLTLANKACRRTAAWSLGRGSTGTYCWPHACDIARDRGATELVQWITGQRRPVPDAARKPDDRPLPTGVAAIVRELRQARTKPALARCRRAIIADPAACSSNRLGLKREIREALAAAKTRAGVRKASPPLRTGVRRR
jgi:hypothetical protein